MYTKLIIFSIILFFHIYQVLGQSFPNFSLNNTSCSPLIPGPDEFGKGSCTTINWIPASGSPDISTHPTFGRGFQLGMGCKKSTCTPENCNQCNGNQAEAIIYQGNFRKGQKYKLSFRYASLLGTETIDRFGIKLVNNLNNAVFTPPADGLCDVDDRFWNDDRFFYDNLSGQKLLLTTNISSNFISDLIEIQFVPDNNFNQILFYAFDNNFGGGCNGNNLIQSPFLEVYNLDMTCCDLDKLYEQTEFNITPPGMFHKQLPPWTQVKNTITVRPLAPYNIFVKTGENVDLRAGQNISLVPTATNSIIIEKGSLFSAKVEPCNCDSPDGEYCDNFVPVSPSNPKGFDAIFFPNAFSPNADGINDFFAPSSSVFYTFPYNAHYGKFLIFDRWGNLLHQQEYFDPCNGIPNGFFKWSGCAGSSAAGTGVYTWTLELKNCHTSNVYSGDVTLVGPVIISCPSSFSDELTLRQTNTTTEEIKNKIIQESNFSQSTIMFMDNSIAIKALQSTRKKEKKSDITGQLVPNPISGQKGQLILNLSKKEIVNIFITDVHGRMIQQIISNELLEQGTSVKELSIEGMSNGVYFVNVVGENSRETLKFVKN